jgi:hypothetical protein
MRPETELERLAAARPAILDRTHEVVSPAEQEQVLRQILADPRGHHTPPAPPVSEPWRASAGTGSPYGLRSRPPQWRRPCWPARRWPSTTVASL